MIAATLLADVTETTQRVFEFSRMPGGWSRLLFLTLLAAAGWAVVWMYRREARRGASARTRTALALTRCAVLLALAVIWLDPVLATSIVRTVTARVVVLVDASASMAIADPPDPAAGSPASAESQPPTRLARVETLLRADHNAWLRRLAEQNDLSLFTFGRQTRRLADFHAAPRTDAQAPLPPLPDASQLEPATDLGDALASALDADPDSPLAAVLLLTDGAVNQGMSQDEILAYARLASRGRHGRTPIHVLGVGSLREPPNLRIASLSAPATVGRGDPFEVRVEVAAEAIDKSELPADVLVELFDEPDAGDEPSAATAPADAQPLATRTVSLAGASSASVAFPVTAASVGERTFRARVAPLPGEPVTADNVRETTVIVLDSTLRVLIVAGGPTREYRFLTTLLERDKTIDVSCWLQSADPAAIRDGNTPIRELPRKSEDVFAYDAILLLDPNPAGLDSSWAVTVRRFVDEFGGGLLYVAGQHSAARFLREPAMQDLVAILPVIPDPDAVLRLGEAGNFAVRSFPLLLSDDSRDHPLLQLDDDPDRSARIWAALPGVWTYVPVLREKPVATVLLRHGGPAARNQHGQMVLLAAQPFGAGRTAFLAFDGTWRWRATGERLFNRFWVQMVRYLSWARRQTGNKRGMISIERAHVQVGEPFRIEARVLDETFAPWHEPQVTLTIELPGQSPVPVILRATPGRDGWYAGRAAIQSEGAALLRLPLPGGAIADAATARVRVTRPDLELRSLRQHGEFLAQLAEETGGQYLPLDAADRLRVDKATQVRVTRGPDLELWDRAWVLLIIVALLAAEWFVRRRSHLA